MAVFAPDLPLELENAMKQKPEMLYLDLMKKTLSFTLWPEPPMPITVFKFAQKPVKRLLISAMARTVDAINSVQNVEFQMHYKRKYSELQRAQGQIWPGYADTMIGLKRLDNLQHCVETVLKEGVEGDFIETGVWRGGA